MKAFLLFFALALFAMAAARPGGVNVVENDPQQVHFVDNNNPGEGYYGGYNTGHVNVVDNNPGYVNVVDNNNPNNPGYVHVVNNNPGQDAQFVISNPDPAFGRPTYNNPNGQGEPVDISPTFVNQRYPPKQYDNPYARGGK